ncbi:ChrR family anti-sigma-E factor [Vibrio sp. RC27]
MINYHPSSEVIKQFVEGKTSVSVSVVVSAHVEMCPECQKLVEEHTLYLASIAFESDGDMADVGYDTFKFGDSSDDDSLLEEYEIDMIDEITSDQPEKLSPCLSTVTEIDVAGKRISLPRSMRSVLVKDWKGFGKISRARLQLDDGARRASLLHISEGGLIPAHTHRGFEITLILQGSFEDELGRYSVGDYIELNTAHTHTPITHEGCVCLTVSDDALQFKQGMSQVINPIGKLIY